MISIISALPDLLAVLLLLAAGHAPAPMPAPAAVRKPIKQAKAQKQKKPATRSPIRSVTLPKLVEHA